MSNNAMGKTAILSILVLVGVRIGARASGIPMAKGVGMSDCRSVILIVPRTMGCRVDALFINYRHLMHVSVVAISVSVSVFVSVVLCDSRACYHYRCYC